MAALHGRLARARARRGRLRRAGRRPHGAAQGRPAPLHRAVPVPRRAHAVVRHRPGREALPLLRLRRGRRRLQVRDGDRGARLRRRRWSRSPTAPASSSRPRRRTRGRPSAATARARLLALLERTAAYYVRVLWESHEAADAREYLLGRGLTEGALRQFRVGYSPSAWDTVLNASRRAGYANEELFAAGLAMRGREGRIYDVFRGRIMFPLADRRGRVRGFGARAMRDGQGPKYVNTREGEVFPKGRQLFGIDIARAAAAKAGAVVLAEGYTDVIALHQAGIGNAVGSMGTALTAEQARELGSLAPRRAPVPRRRRRRPARRRCARPRCCRSAARAARRAAAAGSRPRGHRGGGGRGRADDAGCSIAPCRSRASRSSGRSSGAGADASARPRLDEVANVIRPLPPGILRDELVKLASGRLGISPELVESAVAARAAAPTAGAAAGRPLRRAPPTAPARRSTAASSPSAPSSRSASRCRSSARRSSRDADLDAVFTSPRPAAPPRCLRGHLAAPSARSSATRTRARPRWSPSSSSAPAASTPPRPRSSSRRLQLDLHRLDREISAAAHTEAAPGMRDPRRRAPARARRDPPSPAVAAKFRPAYELVFVSWNAPGWRPRLAEGRSIESIASEVGKHPSTVAYWVKKHGLRRARRAACGAGRRDARGAPRARGARHVGSPDRVGDRAELRRDSVLAARSTSSKPSRCTTRDATRSRRPRRSASARRTAGPCFVRSGLAAYYRCPACTSSRVAECRRRVKDDPRRGGGRPVRARVATTPTPGALQFHHVDPRAETLRIGSRRAHRPSRVREEARKCVLLCGNCHAEVEAGLRGSRPPGR